MKKSIVLVLATAVITGALCFFVFQPRSIPPKQHLSVPSPDGKFVAVVDSNDLRRHDTGFIVQGVRIIERVQLPGAALSESEDESGVRGNAVASIHSCEDSDIEVTWTSDTAVLIRYSQAKPDWVSFVRTADGITISLEEVSKKPNQSSQPTRLAPRG